ncbi:hypothetical protein OG21DRAFT_1475511 [Imleria badia]|nr:hypothetical protein OG21DRAFT_1475511 [Imleria badia]
MSSTAKAKTAKLIRTLLNYFNDIPNSRQVQIDVFMDNLDWSKREKRIFLKHSLEIRLMILTDVHLLESRVYRGIGNFTKAKVHKDYNTAYSYFFEKFENMTAQDDPSALTALKYMLLCKVMLNLPEDVTSLLSIKLATKYAQLREIECMRAIAIAHQNRNLAESEKVLRDHKDGQLAKAGRRSKQSKEYGPAVFPPD